MGCPSTNSGAIPKTGTHLEEWVEFGDTFHAPRLTRNVLIDLAPVPNSLPQQVSVVYCQNGPLTKAAKGCSPVTNMNTCLNKCWFQTKISCIDGNVGSMEADFGATTATQTGEQAVFKSHNSESTIHGRASMMQSERRMSLTHSVCWCQRLMRFYTQGLKAFMSS